MANVDTQEWWLKYVHLDPTELELDLDHEPMPKTPSPSHSEVQDNISRDSQDGVNGKPQDQVNREVQDGRVMEVHRLAAETSTYEVILDQTKYPGWDEPMLVLLAKTRTELSKIVIEELYDLLQNKKEPPDVAHRFWSFMRDFAVRFKNPGFNGGHSRGFRLVCVHIYCVIGTWNEVSATRPPLTEDDLQRIAWTMRVVTEMDRTGQFLVKYATRPKWLIDGKFLLPIVNEEPCKTLRRMIEGLRGQKRYTTLTQTTGFPPQGSRSPA
ncbi:hypothetical protein F5Y15DRAFT_411568 [Xylariaceae sp. FL0016]|nr:hypothetical protein F5Y15DRAFT_411568 [Xylariaceae sp. FL0016]